MSATLITLPVIRPMNHTLDFIEQSDREYSARRQEQTKPPYRTRPLLVVNNGKWHWAIKWAIESSRGRR